MTTPSPISDQAAGEPFQRRVQPWMLACFGLEIANDRIERNHRFFEEATEAVQANGMTRSEAHQLVDYTFDRPIGELHQEIGGVMVTLAALCLASDEDMHAAGETELARIWTKVEKIRAKQAAKPKHSPLPESTAPTTGSAPVAIIPPEWLALMEECATFHGKMVKGNWLSSEAKRLLATRDAAPSGAPITHHEFGITSTDCAAFARLYSTMEDGEGYDVPKEKMERLADIGLIRKVRGSVYEFTKFGLAMQDSLIAASAQRETTS
ncbi:hypothetical protein LJR034_004639 [Caballeronia sp. LjRoot34]|uniref:hypothetical protein n=1 Tax=Caballeronia sp. LjRoot34 TaxID=3342325 RepID=UPI003ECD2139